MPAERAGPNDARAFFNSYRRSARQGGGLYPLALRSSTYTAIGPLQKLQGRSYYRQRAAFRGARPSGSRILGEIVLDVFVIDGPNGVCGQRAQVRSAPARGFSRSIRLLSKIQSLIFGPR